MLDSFDLGVAPGEIVALLGRNGSGKSTLIRLVAGLLSPHTGTIRVVGDRTVVGDRCVFLEALTGRENLGTTLDLRRSIPGGTEWLERFSLAPDADRPVAQYSFGMKRRLALAEAFAGDPALTVLDEPTIGLDPDGKATLADVLRERAHAGRSTLLATNDAAFAEVACDRVVFVHRGRAVADAAPPVLMAALDVAAVIEADVSGARPTADQPPGIRVATAATGELTITGADLRMRLPEVLAWLGTASEGLRAVRVRRPTLADAYSRIAGEPLDSLDSLDPVDR